MRVREAAGRLVMLLEDLAEGHVVEVDVALEADQRLLTREHLQVVSRSSKK